MITDFNGSQRIELVGPGGIGKTTLYEAILKDKRAKDFVSYQNFSKIINGLHGRSLIVEKLQRLFRKVANRFYKNAPNGIDSIQFYSNKNWQIFLEDALATVICEKLSFDKMLMVDYVIYLMKKVRKIEAIENKPRLKNKFVLVDEGLLVSYMSEKGMLHVPPPAMAIFLFCKPEVLVERIIQRKDYQLNEDHKSLTPDELLNASVQGLAHYRQLFNALQKRGVRVQELNSEDPVVELADKVFEALSRQYIFSEKLLAH